MTAVQRSRKREFFTRLRRNIEYETLGSSITCFSGTDEQEDRIVPRIGNPEYRPCFSRTVGIRKSIHAGSTLMKGRSTSNAPDFTVSWIETSSAVTALEQENVEVSKGLRDDVKGAASAIQGVILQERERLVSAARIRES
jgi:hypothetical protein